MWDDELRLKLEWLQVLSWASLLEDLRTKDEGFSVARFKLDAQQSHMSQVPLDGLSKLHEQIVRLITS